MNKQKCCAWFSINFLTVFFILLLYQHNVRILTSIILSFLIEHDNHSQLDTMLTIQLGLQLGLQLDTVPDYDIFFTISSTILSSVPQQTLIQFRTLHRTLALHPETNGGNQIMCDGQPFGLQSTLQTLVFSFQQEMDDYQKIE